jgi:hypothetical protein
MNDPELREVVKRLAETQEETFRHMKAEQEETFRHMRAEREEAARQARAEREEAARQARAERAEMDRFRKEVGRQLGDLGRKFGGYTEGLALPAVKKLLYERFKMDVVGEYLLARKNGRSLELDAFGLSNQEHGDAYIVEIEGRVGEDEFQQILNTLREAPKFFPQFRDKRVYGLLVAVQIPENMRRRILNAGLYLMLPHDDTFKLAVPRGFKPKAFYDGTKRS